MKQSGKSYELRNRVSLRSIQAALNPQHQAAYCSGAIHRQLVRIFPYGIYYVAVHDKISVIGGLHARKNPLYR